MASSSRKKRLFEWLVRRLFWTSLGALWLGGVLVFVATFPSSLPFEIKLSILQALFTSGTILVGLTGAVVTFVMSSAISRVESLRRDRNDFWRVGENARLQAQIQAPDRKELESQTYHTFVGKLEELDKLIDIRDRKMKNLVEVTVILFATLMLQLLITLRAMAEVTLGTFPNSWMDASVLLLTFALFTLGALVSSTAR